MNDQASPPEPPVAVVEPCVPDGSGSAAGALTPRLRAAIELTFRLHGADARKDSPVPVLCHLFSVCALVQGDGGDEDEAIAGLLHDALEDKPGEITREEIQRRFGDRVLECVAAATDTPPGYRGGGKPCWRVRKEAYLAHVGSTVPELLRVTVADKVDNVGAILADYHRLGDQLWSRFNAPKDEQCWYYRSAMEAYRAAGVHTRLLDELARLVDELELVVRGGGA